jgi:hypothetical protein
MAIPKFQASHHQHWPGHMESSVLVGKIKFRSSISQKRTILITNNITDDWEIVDYCWLLLIVVGYSVNN